MLRRYRQASLLLPFQQLRPFAALRAKFREGYTWSDLRADAMSGLVVAAVAVPLAMALSIASGVPPQHGLYTVIIAGALTALLGGSRFQVSGPTAAFVVILAPITHRYGVGGLLLAGMMAGGMILTMGLVRMGRLIQYIPHPVTTGFTAGIAVVIATLQFKDLLGLTIHEMPERFVEKLGALVTALPTVMWTEFGVGLVTLLILFSWPKVSKKIPAPIIALSAVTCGCAVLSGWWPGFEIATISSRFGGIPGFIPSIHVPWSEAGPNGFPIGISLELVEALIPPAFAIAILGSIESLLSAVVADGMSGTEHDPDAELVALGTANLVTPFFGGIAATGAIARTATNIRYGARSPLSAVFHAGFTLIAVLIFSRYVSYLPMAALAALLLVVAYNMSEFRHFIHVTRVAPRSDVAVLLICFSLTVLFDMIVGVSIGVVLAALLFMRRMAATTAAHVVEKKESQDRFRENLPDDVIVYEIAGPLFFGAAKRAVTAITAMKKEVRSVIFVLNDVPLMDVTGLVALETSIERLLEKGKKVVIVGLRQQPRTLILKSVILSDSKRVKICESIHEAISDSGLLPRP